MLFPKSFMSKNFKKPWCVIFQVAVLFFKKNKFKKKNTKQNKAKQTRKKHERTKPRSCTAHLQYDKRKREEASETNSYEQGLGEQEGSGGLL